MTILERSAESEALGGFDAARYARLFEAEDRHFWFRARNSVLAAALRPIEAQLRPGYRVIEVGCGTGYVLRLLGSLFARGTVVGVDALLEGLQRARARTPAPVVAADARRLPFAVPFHIVGMFDVLEHIPDDESTLNTLRALLCPGGALVLTVPAGPELWSYADHVGHHCRRYTRDELRCKLIAAGFEVEYLTPFMTLLYPILRIGRRLGASAVRDETTAVHAATNELRIVPIVNAALARLLALEARAIARRRRLPFGTSLLAVARRPGSRSPTHPR
ncbi:MAG: class I SAM-dependent methyltransferase [Gemmatimonadota bacterium]|nr:class I SAM-dependent methyltransferase [Gemmatimonadota bacterium]